MNKTSDRPTSDIDAPDGHPDKWLLRRRLLAHLHTVQPGIRSAQDEPDPEISSRLKHLFRPRPPKPVRLSGMRRILRIGANIHEAISEFIEGLLSGSLPPVHRATTAQDVRRHANIMSGPVTNGAPARAASAGMRLFRRYGTDIISSLIAAIAFLFPLLVIRIAGLHPTVTETSIVLVAFSLTIAILFGRIFGAVAIFTSCIWIGFSLDNLPHDTPALEWFMHLIAGSVVATSLALAAFGIGTASTYLKNLFKLGRLGLAREADIANYQRRLLRARHIETIYAFLVSYCRTTLMKRCVFLALVEGDTEDHEESASSLANQLRTLNYAQVVVDRKTYVPRAIKSFKSAGLAAYPLETPSGIIGILGIDIARGGKISAIDDRYLRLLLFSVGFAIERIKLTQQVSKLEDLLADEIAYDQAITSLVGNLSTTSENLSAAALTVRDHVNHNPDHPLNKTASTLERQIGSLRNSIALLRDVASRDVERES